MVGTATSFTSPLAKMDFREGGVSLVCMRAPKEFGGFDMYNTWTYTKIVPHERIEFTLNFSDKDQQTRSRANGSTARNSEKTCRMSSPSKPSATRKRK